MTEFEKMISFESLYEAHKKCRLSKQDTKSVIEFEMNLGFELTMLEQKLKNYTYRIGNYYSFTVHDPKERIIQALGYRDRVIQHSLCDNVLRTHLEPRLIYDNSACRIGKGTHFSMNRLSQFMRRYYREHGSQGYIMKYDIRKYFDSIDHEVLFLQMKKVFSEEREILGLLQMIIRSYETSKNKGLPMGNQSSQWFGLYYLNGLDHFIKEKLRIKYYTRYMDDGILIHHDKEYLKDCKKRMEEYIADNLRIEFNEKTQIVPMRQGVDYLGFHFYLTDTGKVIKKLRTSSKKRLKRKLSHYKRAYRDGKIELDAISRSMASFRGHLSHGTTHSLEKNMLNQFILHSKKGD